MAEFLWGIAPAACAALATALTAALATRIARRVGWVDGGTGVHKLGAAPWPLTGGAALFAGLAVLWCFVEWRGRAESNFVPGRALAITVGEFLGREVTLWPFGAVATAFAVGMLDDGLEDGLSPRLKCIGQATAGWVLAAPMLLGEPASIETFGVSAALVLGAVVATNAINTFDNADGAALGVALLGLLGGAAPFAATLVGFAPFNMQRDRPGGWRRKAILGDAGSHVLGILILLTPSAWPVLVLPIADLARLCWVRSRLGLAPWAGDRRHLAHRMARAGWGPWRVAGALVAIAAPGVFAAQAFGPTSPAAWGGGALTLACFAWALRCAPAAPEPAASSFTEPVSGSSKLG